LIGARRAGAGAVLLLLGVSGCAARVPSAPPRPYAGEIPAPGSYPGDFLDRQKIVARYGDRRSGFDAVLQKQGDEVLLVGLTPFGSRAFVLKQSGREISFEAFIAPALPFPPRYILMDVHRVFFSGLAPPGGALPDGLHEDTRDGEILTERWQDGRLTERRFRRADADPPGEIRVDYGQGMGADGTPPAHIAFYNGWFGYSLDITTVSHQRL
jgi:hypothetical protein